MGLILNMKSGNFSHTFTSTLHKKSQNITWKYDSSADISFYIDGDLFKGMSDYHDGKKKFLWGLESRHFNQSFHLNLRDNLNNLFEVYDHIFTYDENLVELHPRIKWVPAMGTWIENPGIRNKKKLASMVTSGKTITPEQVFRVDYANKHADKLDLFGGLVRPIKFKEEALDDYMFSVAIENDVCDSYFTEKILDCFATCTIPIYKGTRKIVDFFNSDGIIFIEDSEFPVISQEIYESKRNAILENLEKVRQFNTIEDWMYTNYKKIITN